MQAAANVDALLDFVRRHPRLFVITGAGCSTEVGIPDYRDHNGEWKRPQPVTSRLSWAMKPRAGATGRAACWAGG